MEVFQHNETKKIPCILVLCVYLKVVSFTHFNVHKFITFSLSWFYSDCVFSGEHRLPVFKGKPDADVLDQLSRSPPETVLEGSVAVSQRHVSNT